jgi:hypothetical protein
VPEREGGYALYMWGQGEDGQLGMELEKVRFIRTLSKAATDQISRIAAAGGSTVSALTSNTAFFFMRATCVCICVRIYMCVYMYVFKCAVVIDVGYTAIF